MDMIKNVEMNAAVVTENENTSSNQQPVQNDASTQEQASASDSDSEKKQEEKKKTKKHRNVEHCKVDFDKKAIIITKEFAKQASIIDTPEFSRLADLCRAYPKFKVISRTAKKSATRPSMKGLTKEFMEKHIKMLHNADWALYLRQKEISEAFKCPHMYMRKWFVEHYPNWREYVIQETV